MMRGTRLDFPVAVAQMSPVPGDIRVNMEKVNEYSERAHAAGAGLVVFPELCTSGYLLGDRWEHNAFINEIEETNQSITNMSGGFTIVWGSVVADHSRIGEDGRLRKYNAACIASDGKFLGFVPKTNLPKYRIFDDARHFYSAASLAAERGISLADLLETFTITVDGRQVTLALAVCEDLWEDEYKDKLSLIYRDKKPDLLIDISQSPWTAEKWHARDRMLVSRAKDTGCPILYVNGVGLQNNSKNLVWFDGSSSLTKETGECVWRAPQHEEGLFFVNPSHQRSAVREHMKGIEEIHDALICATHAFYGREFARVIVGLSGGVDSAASAGSLVEAIGADKVLAINMPGPYNSPTTQRLARMQAAALGIEYVVMPITEQHQVRMNLLGSRYSVMNDFDRGNQQARIRGQILADVSALEATKLGGRVAFTCNGNKAEIALNYFTLYGDGAGMTAFFGDLWKRQIYGLAPLVGVIPEIMQVTPAHELSPDQNVDQGIGDSIIYAYHDWLLPAFTDRRWDPTNIMEHALYGDLEEVLGCVPGTIKNFFRTRPAFVRDLEWAWAQYSYDGKRHMLPPVFDASRRAFGFDRRDTIAPGYLTREYFELKAEYLHELWI